MDFTRPGSSRPDCPLLHRDPRIVTLQQVRVDSSHPMPTETGRAPAGVETRHRAVGSPGVGRSLGPRPGCVRP